MTTTAPNSTPGPTLVPAPSGQALTGGSTTVLTLNNILTLNNRFAHTVLRAGTASSAGGPAPNYVYYMSPPPQNFGPSVVAASGPKTPREIIARNVPGAGDYFGTVPPSGDRRGSGSGGPRRSSTDRAGKGLRHFSMKVCEKVHRKGVTTYNEVADELVAEYAISSSSTSSSLNNHQGHHNYNHHLHSHHHSPAGYDYNDPTMSGMGAYDHKNIRRRVYDALNVLMAMNIISKEKKEIRWIGLPTNSLQESNNLEKEKRKRIERIKEKQSELNNLLLKQIALKNLIEKNRRDKVVGETVPPHVRNGGNGILGGQAPAPADDRQGSEHRQMESLQGQSSLFLPFILINTEKSTEIDCSISNDKCEYYFNFNNHFEVNDDFQILKKLNLTMGLDEGKPVDKSVLDKALSLVPKTMHPYVKAMATGTPSTLSPTSVSHHLNGSYHRSNNDNTDISNYKQNECDIEVASVLQRQANNGGHAVTKLDDPEDTYLLPSLKVSAPSTNSHPINNSFTNGSLATLQFKNFITAKNLIATLGCTKNPPATPNPLTNDSVPNGQPRQRGTPQQAAPGSAKVTGSTTGNNESGGSTSTSDIFSSEDSNGSQSNSSSLGSLRP